MDSKIISKFCIAESTFCVAVVELSVDVGLKQVVKWTQLNAASLGMVGIVVHRG